VSNVSVQKGGDIIEHFAEYIPQINRWRLSILARPDGNSTMFLRGFLRQNGKTLSETWTYKLP